MVRRSKDAILEHWIVRTRTELPAAGAERTSVLIDHIPVFLDQLVEILDPSSKETATTKKSVEVPEIHGQKRAELSSYSLPQVLWEYSLLRRVIFEALETKRTLARMDRDLLLDAFERSMCHAAAAFAAKRTAKEKEERDEVAEERDRLYAAAQAILGQDKAVMLNLSRRPS